MKRIPNNTIWKQQNLGDFFPELNSTFNIDLTDEQGKLKISPRMLINTKDTDADLGVPSAFAYNDNISKWMAICNTAIFLGGNSPSDAFVQDTATDSPTIGNSRADLTVFNISGNDRAVVVSDNVYVMDSDGSDWDTVGSTVVGNAGGAPGIVFKGYYYYCVSRTVMNSVNSSLVAGTYSLDTNDYSQFINCGTKNSDYIWLGTLANPGVQFSLVYKWNGSATSVTSIYEIPARGVLAMCVLNNTPYLIDSEGTLRKFNGGGFYEIARLPFDNKKILPNPIGTSSLNRMVHFNGMIADDDRILINVNASYADGTLDENVPSGWWCYTELNGLHHLSSPSLWENGVSSSETDFGAMKISQVGAIAKAKHAVTADNGSILAGYQYYTDATTKHEAIFFNDLNDTKKKYGSFTSYWMKTDSLKENWTDVCLGLKKLLNSTDRVNIKWRQSKSVSAEYTGTWTSTTTFTVSSDLSAYEGYEIEVLNGVGAGKASHISSASYSNPTTTVTVDETYAGATGTFIFRLQQWTKLATFTDQTDEIPVFGIETSASRKIQLKICVECTGKFELDEIIVNNSINQ